MLLLFQLKAGILTSIRISPKVQNLDFKFFVFEERGGRDNKTFYVTYTEKLRTPNNLTRDQEVEVIHCSQAVVYYLLDQGYYVHALVVRWSILKEGV